MKRIFGTKGFFKKIFSATPKGVKRRKRKTGYYWVQWSYARDSKPDVWRIGFYNHQFDNWSITGDARYYHDFDFLGIDERGVQSFPWLSMNRLLLYISFFACLMSVAISIYFIITNITK